LFAALQLLVQQGFIDGQVLELLLDESRVLFNNLDKRPL